MTFELDNTRWNAICNKPLPSGVGNIEDGLCAVARIVYAVSGEVSDLHECVPQTIRVILIALNDSGTLEQRASLSSIELANRILQCDHTFAAEVKRATACAMAAKGSAAKYAKYAKYAAEYAKYAESAAEYAESAAEYAKYAESAAKYAAEYAAKYAKYAAEYAEYAAESAKYAAEYAAKYAKYAAEYAAKYAKYAAESAVIWNMQRKLLDDLISI